MKYERQENAACLGYGERGRKWYEMRSDVMRWRKPSAPGWTDQGTNGQNHDGTFLLVGDYSSAECDPKVPRSQGPELRGKNG